MARKTYLKNPLSTRVCGRVVSDPPPSRFCQTFSKLPPATRDWIFFWGVDLPPRFPQTFVKVPPSIIVFGCLKEIMKTSRITRAGSLGRRRRGGEIADPMNLRCHETILKNLPVMRGGVYVGADNLHSLQRVEFVRLPLQRGMDFLGEEQSPCPPNIFHSRRCGVGIS